MSEIVEKVAAAISAALKEPPDEMLRIFLKDGWNAMIDEALK